VSEAPGLSGECCLALVERHQTQVLKAALRHALAFSTWRSLSSNGVGRSDTATLITALIEAADGDRNSPPSITALPHPVSSAPAA
jgi:hypothetical protein